MIMCMFKMPFYEKEKIVCVTNRHLAEDFFSQVEKVAAMGIRTIILREKDLTASEYEKLAREVLSICMKYKTDCILHNFYEVAEKLCQEEMSVRPTGLHLPIQQFLTLTEEQKKQIPLLGVSVHSLSEAGQCEQLGASYVTVGHIFTTDCKKDVPPRGLSYLKEICEGINIPVYAIGGIHAENMDACLAAGAKKVCMMSDLMRI